MKESISLTQAQLPELLLNVAVVRPVFIWGAPGIGKSALFQQFAERLGLDCVSLLGSQLAPEDLIGVPQIVDGKSRFCPPVRAARPCFLRRVGAGARCQDTPGYGKSAQRAMTGVNLLPTTEDSQISFRLTPALQHHENLLRPVSYMSHGRTRGKGQRRSPHDAQEQAGRGRHPAPGQGHGETR